jgi:hypothetical protein
MVAAENRILRFIGRQQMPLVLAFTAVFCGLLVLAPPVPRYVAEASVLDQVRDYDPTTRTFGAPRPSVLAYCDSEQFRRSLRKQFRASWRRDPSAYRFEVSRFRGTEIINLSASSNHPGEAEQLANLASDLVRTTQAEQKLRELETAVELARVRYARARIDFEQSELESRHSGSAKAALQEASGSYHAARNWLNTWRTHCGMAMEVAKARPAGFGTRTGMLLVEAVLAALAASLLVCCLGRTPRQ